MWARRFWGLLEFLKFTSAGSYTVKNEALGRFLPQKQCASYLITTKNRGIAASFGWCNSTVFGGNQIAHFFCGRNPLHFLQCIYGTCACWHTSSMVLLNEETTEKRRWTSKKLWILWPNLANYWALFYLPLTSPQYSYTSLSLMIVMNVLLNNYWEFH